MKYLILAYGAEKDWKKLTPREQEDLLAQDEVMRKRGDTLAAVQLATHTVRAWDGTPDVTDGPFAQSAAPLAGFGIVDAASLDEVVQLVSATPCARAKGAVEIRRIREI